MLYILLFAVVLLILKGFAIIVVGYGGIFAAIGVILACCAIARYIEPSTPGRY